MTTKLQQAAEEIAPNICKLLVYIYEDTTGYCPPPEALYQFITTNPTLTTMEKERDEAVRKPYIIPFDINIPNRDESATAYIYPFYIECQKDEYGTELVTERGHKMIEAQKRLLMERDLLNIQNDFRFLQLGDAELELTTLKAKVAELENEREGLKFSTELALEKLERFQKAGHLVSHDLTIASLKCSLAKFNRTAIQSAMKEEGK